MLSTEQLGLSGEGLGHVCELSVELGQLVELLQRVVGFDAADYAVS